jgi:4-azaleucine resistance transporter AzlC
VEELLRIEEGNFVYLFENPIEQIVTIELPLSRFLIHVPRVRITPGAPVKQFVTALMTDRQKILREGLIAGWPICLGYIPIGLALGVVAQKAGLRPLEVGLMSLLVFAGSAQFIALSMLVSGAGPLSIIVTTFVVNLRHLLMSASLAVHLRGVHKSLLSLFAYGVTDESFAVNMTRFRSGGWGWQQALTVNTISNLTWIAGTMIGCYAGELIPAGAFGIDYALTAMFICLLIFQIRSLFHIFAAVISGVLAVILSLGMKGNLYVVMASVIAATVCLFIQRRKATSQEGHE